MAKNPILLQTIDHNSKSYPVLLTKRLGRDAPDRLRAIGPLTAALSEQRNKLVAALADEVYFAHVAPGGKTARLAEQIAGWGLPRIQ